MNTGLIPAASNEVVRLRKPIKCDTTLPLLDFSGPPSPSGERSRIVVRNWYAVRKASTPIR